MASYRTVQSSIVNMPALSASYDQKYSQLASIFGTAMKGVDVGLQIASSQLNEQNNEALTMKKLDLANSEMQNQQQVAQLRLEENNLQNMAIELEQQRKETLKLQQFGLPALLANTPPEERASIIKNHPQLLPEIQTQVAEYVSKSLADEDASVLSEALAADPNADLQALSNDLVSKRSFADELSRANYSLKMEQNKQLILSKASIDAAEGSRIRAIDGVAGEFSSSLAANLSAGTLTAERFNELYSSLSTNLKRLNPKLSDMDIKASAVQELTNYLVGPAGKNLGLSPESMAEQINDINAKIGSSFPELGGISAAINTEIAKARSLQSTAIENDMTDLVSGADSIALLDSIGAAIKSHNEAGRLSTPSSVKLFGKIEDRKQKLQLDDDVYKAIGPDQLDASDNSTLSLSDAHNESIDRVATRLNLQGSDRAVWMVRNFGRLTGNELDAIRNQASIPSPVALKNAFETFYRINKENPVYARSLSDGKTLPAKLDIALHMSVFSVEDIDLVLSQLSQVNDEDLIAAKNDLLKPRKAGDSKNTSGMKLNEIYAIGEKLGVGDVYDKQIQDTYVEAASLYAALIRKQKGLTDDKQVFEAADALATKFLVRNVSVKEIDGDKYAIFNRQIGRINFFDEQYKHLSVLWRQERNKLARELGVDSDDLRLNMNDAVRANGELKIPVLLNDIQGFSGDVSFFSVPAERTAIKNKVDTVLERNKASQVYPARRFK